MNMIKIKDGYKLTENTVNPIIEVISTSDSDTIVTVKAKYDTSVPVEKYTIKTIYGSPSAFEPTVPIKLTITATIGPKQYAFTANQGDTYGVYRCDGNYIAWNPLTDKWSINFGGTVAESQETATPETVTSLTFKATVGGIPTTFATGTASNAGYCSRRSAGKLYPSPDYAETTLLATESTGITAVATAPCILPAGTVFEIKSGSSAIDKTTSVYMSSGI